MGRSGGAASRGRPWSYAAQDRIVRTNLIGYKNRSGFELGTTTDYVNQTLFRIRCHGSYGGLCYTCYLLIVKQNSLVLFSNRLVRGYRRLGDLRWWRWRLRNVSRFLSGRKPRTRTIHCFSCFLMTGEHILRHTGAMQVIALFGTLLWRRLSYRRLGGCFISSLIHVLYYYQYLDNE